MKMKLSVVLSPAIGFAAVLALQLGALGAVAPASATSLDSHTAVDTPMATLSATSANTVGEDPPLETQNAAGDHAMGSTISAHEAAVAAPGARFRSLAAMSQPAGLPGLDVSGWQVGVDWSQVAANGAKFAYVKATESNDYVSSQFSQQYDGAYNAGLIRGAYVFAHPDDTSGAVQAQYFVAHGGGWSPDGRTLPPLLDIEYGTDGTGTCWGMSQGDMVNWISDFSNTMLSLTGRYPAIYSTTDWWTTCTGNSAAFSQNPLFIARYPSSPTNDPGTLPASWSTWQIWQWADSGVFPGDQDVFNGDQASLQSLALNSTSIPPVSAAQTQRIAGNDAYATSALISSSAYSPGVSAVYIATRANYADALSAAPAAGVAKGPVLLVAQGTIPDPVAAELARLKPKRIIVVGGPDVIGDAVLSSLQSYTAGPVTRIAGADRFETSAQISASAFPAGAPIAYVATGLNFPDALSAAAVAAGSRSGPMLLVTPSSVPASIATELLRLHPQEIMILGGADVVSDGVASQLQQYSSAPVVRLAGSDRYATSVAISQANFAPSVPTLYVATGEDFPDALSGAPLAGVNGMPLLLVQSNGIPQEVAAEITRLNPSKIVILGGTSAISAAVQDAL